LAGSLGEHDGQPRGRERPRWFAAALILLAVAAPGLADAAGEAPEAARAAAETTTTRTDARRFGYGIALGYGHGVVLRSRQRGRDVGDVEILTVEPQIRMHLVRAGDGSAWYHGALEATLEGLLMANFEPASGVGGGIDAGLRYRARPGGRVQPFADAALGLGGIDLDLRSQDDGFTFFISASLGARVRLDDRLSLTGALRWQHVSNAQTHQPNNGIDTVGLRVGLELW